MIRRFVFARFITVENDKVGVLHFIENQLTHIAVVFQNILAIKEKHNLADSPSVGHSVDKFSYVPHTVIFYENSRVFARFTNFF